MHSLLCDTPDFDRQAFSELSTIIPPGQQLSYSTLSHGPCKELKYYTDFLAAMINGNKYPYLKTDQGRFKQISFLKKIFKECNFQSYDDDLMKQQLIITVESVLRDMMEKPDERKIGILSFPLWRYVSMWGLVPDNEDLYNWRHDKYLYGDIGSLDDCIDYMDIMTEKRMDYPFLATKIGFLVKMESLAQVFAVFTKSLSSQSLRSDLYRKLNHVKVQYKEWQFDPLIIEWINRMDIMSKSDNDEDARIAMQFLLNMIITSDGRNIIDPRYFEDKLMITLESLTKDIVNAKEDGNIWKFKYLYSLIYDRAVYDKLIPDDAQRQSPAVVRLSEYPYAMKYDIIIFTDDSIKYDDDKSDSDKDAAIKSMYPYEKYPFLPIIILEQERSKAIIKQRQMDDISRIAVDGSNYNHEY